jgi:hypothetical protein
VKNDEQRTLAEIMDVEAFVDDPAPRLVFGCVRLRELEGGLFDTL